jgi:hypothetical protein
LNEPHALAVALGPHLKALREASGLSQKAWAERWGIHERSVGGHELGWHLPGTEFIARLFEHYKMGGLPPGTADSLVDAFAETARRELAAARAAEKDGEPT